MRSLSGTKRRGRTLASAGAVLAGLVLAGCAATTGSPGTAPSTRTVVALPSDQIVFQISTGGGFVPALSRALEVPSLTVYGDGSIYQARYRAEWGTPPELTLGQADPLVVAALAADLESGGLLDDDLVFGQPNVTDLPSTTMLVQGTGSATMTSVYAVDQQFDQYVDDAAAAGKRAEFRGVIDRVAALFTGGREWFPTSVRVISVGSAGDVTGIPPVWKGPDPATFPPGESWTDGCLVVTADADALYRDALDNGDSIWSTPAGPLRLAVVPMLPGDAGC